MGYVVNDVVKKQWDEKRFVTKKGANGKEAFVAACKEYETDEYDSIAVFFTPSQACVYIDRSDDYILDFSEILEVLRTDPGLFPENLDEYCPIMFVDGSTDNEDVIDLIGLRPFLDDIKARVLDLAPYSDEQEVKL